MEELFFVLAIIGIIILWVRSSRLKRTVRNMENRINFLEKMIGVPGAAALKQAAESMVPAARRAEKTPDINKNELPPVSDITKREIEKKVAIPPPPQVKPASRAEQTPVRTAPVKSVRESGTSPAISIKAPQPVLDKKIQAPKETPAWLKKLEKQLVENWTGIIGTAILVMGVGFLAIYAALTLSAVYRFVMICAVALFLFGLFLLLRRREKWLKLSRWLRSGSGAVFLFACLGAGGIRGLKFIEDPMVAIGLLVSSIIINLYFGYAGGTQYFASLHALISLAGLAVAPQGMISLIIAGVVVFFSIAISFRSRWDYHLIFTFSVFFAYHVYCYIQCGFSGSTIPFESRITGITATLAVGIMAVISHYREIYKTLKFETLPFVTHILNWAFLAIGLLMYSTGSKWNTIVFAGAVVVVFFLARRGRSLGIRWLYVTDTLIAQSLALFAVVTLARWNLDELLIAGIAYLQIMLFLIIANREGEWILQKVGIILHHCSLVLVIGMSIVFFDPNDGYVLMKNSVILAVVLLIETVFHLYSVRKNGESFDSVQSYFSKEPKGAVSISGILIPMIASALWVYLIDYFWAPWPIAAVAIFLLIVRHRSQSNGIGIGLVLLTALLFGGSWVRLFNPDGMTKIEMIINALPLFAVAIVMVRTAYIKARSLYVKWAGVYLFSAHLAIVSYVFTEPVSSLIPGVVWLLLSLVYLECAQLLARRYGEKMAGSGSTDRFILQVSYLFTAMFLLRHFLVDFQSEQYLWGMPVRVIIQVYALAVFVYRGLAKPAAGGAPYLSWKYLHPLFWELSLVFSTIIVILQIPDLYHPLIWIATAGALLGIGKKFPFISRMRFHSILYYWAAAFHVTFLLSTSPVPSGDWLSLAWMTGVLVIVLQAVYVTFLYRHAGLDTIECPPSLSFLKSCARFVAKRRNIVIYYLFTAEILYATYRLFDPISTFIPGVLWLIISLVFLELAQRMRRKYGDALIQTDRIDGYMLNSGYASIAAFLVRHFIVHLQSEMYIGPIQIRFLIELFALAVFVYWALAKRPAADHPYAAWKYLHPLMWELSIIFTMAILVLETPEKIHALLWAGGSLLLVLLGHFFKSSISRWRFYSLIFHWIAVFTIAFFLASYEPPSDAWYDRVWVYSSAAIAIQFIYIVMFYKYGMLGSIELPLPVKFLKGIIGFVDRHRNLAVYYPFFISIAIFVYKTFSGTLHTLLWVLEAFGIFIVSIVLKENHFRYLSMGVLAVCMVRLMIYDLAQSGTVVKGIVFVCVGLLMLGMNVLYNKYKDRF